MSINDVYFIEEFDFEDELLKLVDFKNIKNLHIAVGVSGGSDSMLLAILLSFLAKEYNFKVTALIVDHKLREESTKEAKTVKEILKKYNIKAKILTRTNNKLTTKIEETAREDRYKLLTSYCNKKNIPFLAVAHNQGDLIETHIMRQKRKENLVGGSSIATLSLNDNVLIVRPLLKYTKKSIKNTLMRYKQNWIEDPFNKDIKYERVQVRNSLEVAPEEEKEEVLESINIARLSRKELEEESLNFLAENLKISNFGEIKVNYNNFLSLSNKEQIFVLRTLIAYSGSTKKYSIKISKAEEVLKFLAGNKNSKTCIGGVKIKLKDNYLTLVKENRKEKDFVLANGNIYFDERFLVNIKKKQRFLKYLTSKEYDNLEDKKELEKYNLNKDTLLNMVFIFNKEKKALLKETLNYYNSNKIRFFPKKTLFDMFFC